MAIGRPRPAVAPPPLPPPKNVKDLEDGYDLGWFYGNRDHPHATLRDTYPACTSLASRPPNARRESDESEYAPLARRDSSFPAPWAPPTKDIPGYGSGSGSGLPIDEGYGSLSGASLNNAQLQSERHLDRQNRKDSAHAYDKQLLSSLGWPKTPTQVSTADSNEGSPTSRRGSLQSPKSQTNRNLSLSGRSLSVSTDPLSKLNSPSSAGSKWALSPHGAPSGLISPGVTSAGSRAGSFAEPHSASIPDNRSMSGTPTATSSRHIDDGDGIGQRRPVGGPPSQPESNLSLAMSSMMTPNRTVGSAANHRGPQHPRQQQQPLQLQQYGNMTGPLRASPPTISSAGDGGSEGGAGDFEPMFATTRAGTSPATTPSSLTHLPSPSALSPNQPPSLTEGSGDGGPRPAAGLGHVPGGLAGGNNSGSASSTSATQAHLSFDDGLHLQPPLLTHSYRRHYHQHHHNHPHPQHHHPNYPAPPHPSSSSTQTSQQPPLFSPRSQEFSSTYHQQQQQLHYTQLPSRGRAVDTPSRVAAMTDKKRKLEEMASGATEANRPSPDATERGTAARKPNHTSPVPSMASTATPRMGGAVAGYASSTGFDANALAPGATLDHLSPNHHAMTAAPTDGERMLNIDPGLRAPGAPSTQPPNLASIAAQANAQNSGVGGGPEEFSQMHPGTGGARIRADVHICDCCPKKPKKFDTLEELQAHQNEKQYYCRYCNNRFKNKNEAERHQNSLHLRRQSWSCAVLDRNIRAAFHPCTAIPPNTSASQAQQQAQQQQQQYAEYDICGYCGAQFPNEPQPDWIARSQHLTSLHKFGECNQSKKFFRADHFRQHLKHSHAGQSGKWTNMLESACMREEPAPTPGAGGGSGVGTVGERQPPGGPPTLAPHPAPQPAQAHHVSQQSLQLQQKAQMAAAHALSSHQQQFNPGMGASPLSIEQAAALAGATAAGAAAGGAPMAMMGGNPRGPYVTMAPPAPGLPAVQEPNLFAAQPSAAEDGNIKPDLYASHATSGDK